jgi:hypothetical protein
MTVLHNPAETPIGAIGPVGGHTASRRGSVCPECRSHFEPANPRQLFCSAAHKADFHNRQTVRGRQLTAIVMASRQTRDGSRGNTAAGKKARQESRLLMDRWTVEDRAAGRMAMIDYYALRDRRGFDTVL